MIIKKFLPEVGALASKVGWPKSTILSYIVKLQVLLGKAKCRKKILKKILSDFFGIKFWNLLGLTSNFEYGRNLHIWDALGIVHLVPVHNWFLTDDQIFNQKDSWSINNGRCNINFEKPTLSLLHSNDDFLVSHSSFEMISLALLTSFQKIQLWMK